MSKYSLFVVAFIAVFAVFQPKSFSEEVNAGMQELASGADFIFSGTVASAKVEELPNGSRGTRITLKNNSNIIRGNVPAEEFSFMQYGADREESRSSGALFFRDSPQYEVGKRYMLFLTCGKTEPIFCSTVGLKQGSFREIDTPQGTKALINGVGNKNLFVGTKLAPGLSKSLNAAKIDQKSAGQGPVELDSFVNMVKGLVEMKK